MTTSHALCLLDHDPARQAAPGLDVCLWHHRLISQAITQAPNDYTALGHRLVPTGRSSGNGHVTGTRNPGIDLNHRVVQLRTDLRNTHATWARIAVHERGITPPPDTLPAIARFIHRNLDWYLHHPGTTQFAHDMLDNHHDAQRLIDTNPVRSFDVAPCPEPDCQGTLIARLRQNDALLPHDVTCDTSPLDDDGNPLHYWPANTWLTLGRRIRRATG